MASLGDVEDGAHTHNDAGARAGVGAAGVGAGAGVGAAEAGGSAKRARVDGVDVHVELPTDTRLREHLGTRYGIREPVFRLPAALHKQGAGAVLVLSREEAQWVQSELTRRRRVPQPSRGAIIQLRRRIMATLYRHERVSLRELADAEQEMVVREALDMKIDGEPFWASLLNPFLLSADDYSADLQAWVFKCGRRAAPRHSAPNALPAGRERASARTT